MKTLPILSFLLLASSSPSLAQEIVKIECLTSTSSNAQMTFATVDLEIFNDDLEVCLVYPLDDEENNFEKGKLDTFTGSELKDCLNFEVPNYGVTLLRVRHHGPDQWVPEWFRVHFDDGVFVQCNDGYGLDNDEAHELNCF